MAVCCSGYYTYRTESGQSLLLLHQLTLEEILRRTGRERQGRKPQECCRISRLSDAVFRCQDKQENSGVNWGSNNKLYVFDPCLFGESYSRSMSAYHKHTPVFFIVFVQLNDIRLKEVIEYTFIIAISGILCYNIII